MFGVVFPDRSYPMDTSAFAQVDPLHWMLDLSTLVGPGDAYRDVRELCVFLLPAAAAAMPPGKALAVYAQPPGRPFSFCGAVHGARPSALLSLPWPDPAEADASGGLQVALPDAATAKIGVSVEDLAALPPVVDAGAERRVERMALRVGENLFNFIQSFCGVDGNRLIVPTDILNRWFNKFQERAKKDPSYLKGFAL